MSKNLKQKFERKFEVVSSTLRETSAIDPAARSRRIHFLRALEHGRNKTLTAVALRSFRFAAA